MPRRERSLGERLFFVIVMCIALLTALLIVFYQASLSNPPRQHCRDGVCYYSDKATP